MSRNGEKRGQMVSTLFTMLLFLVFVLCALFTVLIGGKVYENINKRSEMVYRGNVALSYIANKVRQGDGAGLVALDQEDGTPVLKLKREINGTMYVTEIYYQDGKLWELFTDEDSGLSVGAGSEIMECNEVVMTEENGLLKIATEGEGGGMIWLSTRSGGLTDE